MRYSDYGKHNGGAFSLGGMRARMPIVLREAHFVNNIYSAHIVAPLLFYCTVYSACRIRFCAIEIFSLSTPQRSFYFSPDMDVDRVVRVDNPEALSVRKHGDMRFTYEKRPHSDRIAKRVVRIS